MNEGKYDFRSIYEADDVTLEAEDDSPFSNLHVIIMNRRNLIRNFLEHQVLHLIFI